MKDYQIALRPDHTDPELMDDIVVHDVELFRAEQMGADEWWVCCYLKDGQRITWYVGAKCRPRRIEWRNVELPDVEYEPQPKHKGKR